jgi:hypothetical protein
MKKTENANLLILGSPFYKILVKVRNSKKNVLTIVLIIVNINKDENKSIILSVYIIMSFDFPFVRLFGVR